MNYKEGKEIIVNRSNAFVTRYFRAYGQLVLRLNSHSYLMSRENLLLNSIKDEDINLYNINTGDVGALFRTRRDINALACVGTESSVAVSMVKDELLPALEDLAMVVGPVVKVSPDNTATNVLKALGNRNGCLIRGVGIIGTGSTIEEAIAAARIIEKSAEAEVYGGVLGGLKYLSDETARELNNIYRTQYSKVNTVPAVAMIGYSEEEFALRNQIIEVGKQMCRDDLVQGTMGNISARLDDRYMLVKPSGMDYFKIRIEDIVKVDYHTLEYDKTQRVPTTECALHAALYRTYPDAAAGIHTHSNGCSVFAAARAGFRIDRPELADVIGDLNVSEYRKSGTDDFMLSVMTALYNSHSCIIANHGAMFYGKDLSTVLAIANAVESRACNLLGFGNILITPDDDHDVKIYHR